ncbi:hypothetical protein [Nostoc sp. PCC 9305]|uniref:hypothetical protein n=1 Tax=Nostoc sp. PCC 9305 TaxID=296636 RepID=UPI0039C6E667
MVVLFAVAKFVNADRNSDAIAATFNNFKKYLILSKKLMIKSQNSLVAEASYAHCG